VTKYQSTRICIHLNKKPHKCTSDNTLNIHSFLIMSMYVFTPFIGFVIHWMISLSIPFLLNASAESRTKKAEKRANSRRNDVIWYSRGTPKAIASSLLYRWCRTNNNISLCIYIYPYLNKEIPQSLRHRIISQVLFSYEISLASWRYFPADTYSRSNGDAISSSNTLYIDHDYFIFLQLFLLFFSLYCFLFIYLFVCLFFWRGLGFF